MRRINMIKTFIQYGIVFIATLFFTGCSTQNAQVSTPNSVTKEYRAVFEERFKAKVPLYKELYKKFDSVATKPLSDQYAYISSLQELIDFASLKLYLQDNPEAMKAFYEVFAPYINLLCYATAKFEKESIRISEAGILMTNLVRYKPKMEYYDTLFVLLSRIDKYELALQHYPKLIEQNPKNKELKENYEQIQKQALYKAIDSNDIGMLESFIKLGINVNIPYKIEERNTQWNALFKAVTADNLEIFKKLIDSNADIYYVDEDGLALFYFTVFMQKIDFAKELIKAGYKPNLNPTGKRHPLAISALKSNREMLEYLISLGFDPKSKVLERKNLLVFVLTSPNDDLKRPINAWIYPNDEMYEYLVELFKGELNSDDIEINYFFLALGVKNNDFLLDKLLENSIDITKNTKGYSPLQFIYSNENLLKNIKRVIDLGVDVNHQDKDGDTPLHEFLIEYEQRLQELKKIEMQPKEELPWQEKFIASVTISSYKEELEKLQEAMKLLIKSGAKTDIKNHKNQTAQSLMNEYGIVIQ